MALEVSQNISSVSWKPNTTAISCGFPGFCKGSTTEIYQQCFNTTLLDCSECGLINGMIFVVLVVVLGLAILVGNILIICVGHRRYKKGKANKLDICRSSLALSDIVTGVKILVFSLYNFSWTVYMTPIELAVEALVLRGTPIAFAVGVLQLFASTSSLFHLCYMALQRIYAIAFPIRYRVQSKTWVYTSLTFVWIIALTTASMPGWFRGILTYAYFPSILLYTPTIVRVNYFNITGAIVMITLVFLVPYAVMTLTAIATGILITIRRKSKKLHSSRGGAGHTIDQQTLRAYIMVTLMQVGFAITQVPSGVMISLIYSKTIVCYDFSSLYMIFSYLSMSNSLLNVIIYNMCDHQYRSEMAAIFSFHSSQRMESVSSSGRSRQANL